MEHVERRAEKRVCPPGDVLLEFALWPAAPEAPARLDLAALGAPTACRRNGDRMRLADVSAIGLGLVVTAVQPARTLLAQAPALFVYLKLRDPRPDAPTDVLSLFFHARTARAGDGPEGLRLGLRLLRQGRGSSFEKALELLDASRFGVSDLASWIDAVVREMERPPAMPGPGLDLDRLLDELRPTLEPGDAEKGD